MIDLIAANHTGRELDLMLEGTKPLSMFYGEISELPDEEIIPELKFSPYLNRGLFVRGEVEVEAAFHPQWNRKVKTKYVFFALAKEAWRIPAIILLKKSQSKTWEWNETLERMESSLLGYTDEEIDAWCASNSLFQKQHKF